METATLVIAAVNLCLTAVAPIIVGVGYLLTHVKRSNCCGGEMEVEHSPKVEKRKKSEPINIKDQYVGYADLTL